ncbi:MULTISPECIES: hypothetical protein [Agrobacterium]|uniref:hypothetical protein n=1 Tax=Agrobacterium tumefaciens TaxID=358 RepID=UPI001571E7E7|nr:hypothetical protein [Agrobacterium tumefaciens]NSZ06338.1 hypothetical protein [Agrobacterium tumefaciens]
MSQNAYARLGHPVEVPANHRAALLEWSRQPTADGFSEDEMNLQRALALVYADPRRPSIRQLHRVLSELIEEDAMRTGIAPKRPSLDEFRSLVLSLPPEYIDHMRYEQEVSAYELIKHAETIIESLAA